MFPCLSEIWDNRAWLVSWCVSIKTLRLVTAAHMQIERGGGGNVRQICLNSVYYITSGAQRRADNIYFYPESWTSGAAPGSPRVCGDTWGLLSNNQRLLNSRVKTQFKEIKIDGLIATCNKCGQVFGKFFTHRVSNFKFVTRISEILFSKYLENENRDRDTLNDMLISLF